MRLPKNRPDGWTRCCAEHDMGMKRAGKCTKKRPVYWWTGKVAEAWTRMPMLLGSDTRELRGDVKGNARTRKSERNWQRHGLRKAILETKNKA